MFSKEAQAKEKTFTSVPNSEWTPAKEPSEVPSVALAPVGCVVEDGVVVGKVFLRLATQSQNVDRASYVMASKTEYICNYTGPWEFCENVDHSIPLTSPTHCYQPT
jgi:hypothetical protein